MDQLITIIIVLAVSAVATVLKKMKQAEETRDAPPADRPRTPGQPPAPRPQRQSTSWEDELRRLLGDESAPPPRPPRPMVAPPSPETISLPPVTSARPSAPVIRSPSPIQPPVRSQPQRQPQASPAPRPRVITAPARTIASAPLPTQPAVARAALLAESQRAYQQAAQLNELTSARVDRAAAVRVQSTVVERPPVSAEVAQVVALFKGAQSARKAVLASIIFGPPPALEQSSTLF